MTQPTSSKFATPVLVILQLATGCGANSLDLVTEAENGAALTGAKPSEKSKRCAPKNSYWRDNDEDGLGRIGAPDGCARNLPDGYVRNSVDCDDNDATIPGDEQLHDEVDNDCDGLVNELPGFHPLTFDGEKFYDGHIESTDTASIHVIELHVDDDLDVDFGVVAIQADVSRSLKPIPCQDDERCATGYIIVDEAVTLAADAQRTEVIYEARRKGAVLPFRERVVLYNTAYHVVGERERTSSLNVLPVFVDELEGALTELLDGVVETEDTIRELQLPADAIEFDFVPGSFTGPNGEAGADGVIQGRIDASIRVDKVIVADACFDAEIREVDLAARLSVFVAPVGEAPIDRSGAYLGEMDKAFSENSLPDLGASTRYSFLSQPSELAFVVEEITFTLGGIEIEDESAIKNAYNDFVSIELTDNFWSQTGPCNADLEDFFEEFFTAGLGGISEAGIKGRLADVLAELSYRVGRDEVLYHLVTIEDDKSYRKFADDVMRGLRSAYSDMWDALGNPHSLALDRFGTHHDGPSDLTNAIEFLLNSSAHHLFFPCSDVCADDQVCARNGDNYKCRQTTSGCGGCGRDKQCVAVDDEPTCRETKDQRGLAMEYEIDDGLFVDAAVTEIAIDEQNQSLRLFVDAATTDPVKPGYAHRIRRGSALGTNAVVEPSDSVAAEFLTHLSTSLAPAILNDLLHASTARGWLDLTSSSAVVRSTVAPYLVADPSITGRGVIAFDNVHLWAATDQGDVYFAGDLVLNVDTSIAHGDDFANVPVPVAGSQSAAIRLDLSFSDEIRLVSLDGAAQSDGLDDDLQAIAEEALLQLIKETSCTYWKPWVHPVSTSPNYCDAGNSELTTSYTFVHSERTTRSSITTLTHLQPMQGAVGQFDLAAATVRSSVDVELPSNVFTNETVGQTVCGIHLEGEANTVCAENVFSTGTIAVETASNDVDADLVSSAYWSSNSDVVIVDTQSGVAHYRMQAGQPSVWAELEMTTSLGARLKVAGTASVPVSYLDIDEDDLCLDNPCDQCLCEHGSMDMCFHLCEGENEPHDDDDDDGTPPAPHPEPETCQSTSGEFEVGEAWTEERYCSSTTDAENCEMRGCECALDDAGEPTVTCTEWSEIPSDEDDSPPPSDDEPEPAQCGTAEGTYDIGETWSEQGMCGSAMDPSSCQIRTCSCVETGASTAQVECTPWTYPL